MSATKVKNENPIFKWIFWGIVLVILLFTIGSSFKSLKTDLFDSKDKTESTEQNGVNSSDLNYNWVIKKEILTPLRSEFGDTYYLSRGEGFSFEESTVPYCVINKNNHSECGTIGEDLSSQFGTENANKELKFKSNNAKNGTLKLIIWIKKFK